MINLIDSPKRRYLSAFDSSVGVYRFRDNSEDESGNGNHMRFTGTVGTQRYSTGHTEPNNTSINLTESGGYLTLSAASSSAFEMDEESFTVEFWINHNNVNQYAGVCGKGGYADGWYIEANGSNHVSRPGGYTLVSSAQILPTVGGDGGSYSFGEWHYVVFTKENNGTATVYVDGRFDNSMSVVPTTGNASAVFHISGTAGITGKLDEFLIHRGLIIDSAQVKERYNARKDLKTFITDKDGVPPYLQKYTTPLTELKFSNSVYNVRTYGINADWQVFSNNTYSTVYSGKVPKVKFYYGLGYPETLVNYKSNPQWKVNYTGFFKPPIDGNYTFKIAGSGKNSYSIANEGSTQIKSDIFKNFDNGTYESTTVPMLSNSAYAFDFGYEYLKGEDSGLVVLWKTDSASITPDDVVLSGGVCNPSDNNNTPPLIDIPYYSKPKWTINDEGLSTLKFEVPFIDNSTAYGGKGYIYDTTNGVYYDTNNPTVKLKEYKYIQYSEGYRSNNEDETVIKFTGQIRDIDTKYSKKGDKLEVTCHDFSIFTRDAINTQSPTPIDYWQAGYIVEDFGRVNGLTKPKTFDGWEAHKAYEVVLIECGIDPYSFIQKKESLNLERVATTAGFFVEPFDDIASEFLPTNAKYGIKPIGEVDAGNVDEKYAYSIDTGEYYQDAINKFFRSWNYKWGVNRYGFPYLTRINVPNANVDSPDFNFAGTGNWVNKIDVNALKGTYSHSTTQSFSTSYVYKDISSMNAYTYTGTSEKIARTTLDLTAASASASDLGWLNYRGRCFTNPKDENKKPYVNFYCTSDADAYLNATTWPSINSHRLVYGEYDYQFRANNEFFGRARTIGLELKIPAYPPAPYRITFLAQIIGQTLQYNESDATQYVERAIATTTVTGKKFALLAGRGPACGSSDPSVKTFRVQLTKDDRIFVDTSINNYDAENLFYYDDPNKSGLNKSYIPLGNGLPYDTYNVKVEQLSSTYQCRLEGVLSFAEDYEVPVATFHSNDADKKGSISKLNVKKTSKDHRNDVVVLGKRKGTLFQVGKDGEEIAVNPNNETNIYVQSAVRDLSSIYNASSKAYMGRPKTTIIVDPSIINKSQADFIALNFIKEYGLPERNPKFDTIGNPLMEINDCVTVKEDWKNGISTNEYVWIKNINTSFNKTYTTSYETTPVKPVDSYWRRPAIDISQYNNNYIHNLTIKNRGVWGKLSQSITTDTALRIDNTFTATALAGAVPDSGYLRIGTELMKYEYTSASPAYIKFGELTRGLGEDGLAHTHYKTSSYTGLGADDVIVGYNPYSFSQSVPTISFDLLADANVSVHIKSLLHKTGSLYNSSLTDGIRVDALTDIEGDLDQPGYEFLPAGHYEFVWGGLDRRGEYNNTITSYEVDMSESQFYANSNYKLNYQVDDSYGSYGGNTRHETYATAFGLFYSEIKVIPAGKQAPFTYTTLGGVDSSYVLDSAGINSSIKTIMNDPGTVDLEIFVDGQRTLELDGAYSQNNYAYNYEPTGASDRRIGYLETVDTAANSFPTAYPPGMSGNNWRPTWMWSESNLNENGDAQGFKWRLNNYSSANHSDINRYYLPTLSYKIVQMVYMQANGKLYYPAPLVTEDVLSKHYSENLRFGTEYYFNTKRVLEEEGRGFIPEEQRKFFIANNPKASLAPMGVTNYTVFMHTLYDMSGRKPKQRRTYRKIADEGATIESMNQYHTLGNKRDNGAVAMYWFQKQKNTAPLCYTYEGSTSNRGMYENNNVSGVDRWQYRYKTDNYANHDSYTTKSIYHHHNHVNEFQHDPGNTYFGELKRYFDVIGDTWGEARAKTFDYGVGRDNYTVWMDEKQVKYLQQYDLQASDYHVPTLYNTNWGRNFNVPLIWAVFTRSDFGDV